MTLHFYYKIHRMQHGEKQMKDSYCKIVPKWVVAP